MVIRFKDFLPEIKKQGWFSNEYATLEETLEKANLWVTQNNVQVLNVETVVLPNLEHRPYQTKETKMETFSQVNSYWYQVIRVWYQS